MSPSLSDLEHRLYAAMEEVTVQNTGTATAPAAGTNIASVALSPGVWEITAYARLGLGGVPAAGDNNNMRLRDETNAVNLLTLPVIATQNSVPVPITVRVAIASGTPTYVIEAVGAGTASVVYCATIVARKVAEYYGD
jgi:hypothetical protein